MRFLLVVCMCAAAVCAAAAPIPIVAQDKKDDKAKAETITVRVHLKKGTLIVGTPKADKLPIKTKYGVLEVPLVEVQSIAVGIHYAKGQKEEIQAAVKEVGSETYSVRAKGSKTLLDHGQHTLPFLSLDDKDLEIKKRCQEAYDKITAANSTLTPQFDVVRTKEMEIKGDIQWEMLEVVSHEKELGTLKLNITSINTLSFTSNGGGEFTLKSDNANWIDTGLYLTDETRLVVEANGSLDLYPQQNAGQYITGPNGSSQAQGKGGSFRAGALIAKVGDNFGFQVGERYSGTPGKTGRLYLQIVDNPWNVQSSGQYTVKVRLE